MAIYNLNDIDTKFDFTSDTPDYWDGFWNNDLGHSAKDPDSIESTSKCKITNKP